MYKTIGMFIKYLIPAVILLSAITQSAMAQESTRIRHTVVFKLKHSPGSREQKDFLIAAKKLSAIPGVEKFECLKQVSTKNKFEYGLSMEFASQTAYDQYTHHSDHVNFVQNVWVKEVDDFLEIDYKVIPN